MSNKIFVGNISYDFDSEELQSAFQEFGEIEEVKIVRDRATGKSRGFGFISFSAKTAADQAIAVMNGKEIKGRVIRVNEARDKERS